MTDAQKALLLDYALSLAALVITKDPAVLTDFDDGLAGVPPNEAHARLRRWLSDVRYAASIDFQQWASDASVTLDFDEPRAR